MTGPSPEFSVVIPSYNRPDKLKACIRALGAQEMSRDRFDIVVVDDGSAEPLEAAAREVQADLNLTCLRQSNAGPARARNRGALAARGKVLALTDDDCLPRPGWLVALGEAYRSNPMAILGGQTVNALADNIYAKTSQDLVDYLYAYFMRSRGHPVFFTTNNMALSRERFLDIGGFDETFPLAAAEDRELCDHWLHRGWPLVHAPAAVVDHAHSLGFVRFWNQHKNYGQGARHLARALEASGRPQHKLEPMSFYLGLLAYPMCVGPLDTRLQRTLLIGLAQLANVAGYITAAQTRAPGSSAALTAGQQ